MKRVMSSGNRWCIGFKNAERTLERELTFEEKYARLESERNLLKTENELLKKSNLWKGG